MPQSRNEGNGEEILPVTQVGFSDIGKLMSPGTAKRQNLEGFDDDYVDIVDYIIRSTHKIWEERGMGLIYTHYRHNAIVHTPYSTNHGRDAVIANSIQFLHAFPDRRAFGEDVIWSGNDAEGFYTSHRIINVTHNTGYSKYGPPTGKRIVVPVIADCLVKENRICEEWLIRDEMATVKQLGLDVRQVVAQLAQKRAASEFAMMPVGGIERVRGQTTPKVLPPKASTEFDVRDFVTRAWHETWNWRLFNKIYEHYAQNFVGHFAGGRELYGQEDLLQFIVTWLTVFPDAEMLIDHFAALGSEQEGFRVAIRWTLVGTHEGYGLYGEPTGKRAHIMGITHQHIKDRRVIAEWTLFDEIALLVQLAAANDHAETDTAS